MRRWVTIAAALACGMTNAMAAGVAGQGTWELTLQARDLDGDGRADAYYDTLQNITWLDGYTAIPGFPNQTLYTSGNGGGTFYGTADWRLPTGVATTSELQTLWNIEFGGARNLGPFEHLFDFKTPPAFPTDVWTSDKIRCRFGSIFAPCIPDPAGTFDTIAVFAFGTGTVYPYNDDIPFRLTTPVHNGDIGVAISAAPEPGTWAMLGAGLLAMTLALRRRRG
jgi:PEP-CTERM motif